MFKTPIKPPTKAIFNETKKNLIDQLFNVIYNLSKKKPIHTLTPHGMVQNPRVGSVKKLEKAVGTTSYID